MRVYIVTTYHDIGTNIYQDKEHPYATGFCGEDSQLHRYDDRNTISQRNTRIEAATEVANVRRETKGYSQWKRVRE